VAVPRTEHDPALLTSDQVTDRLLRDARLRRVAMACVLPAVRCGAEWRYRLSDLEAWIAAQRANPEPFRAV
jgi:hypothetical protein